MKRLITALKTDTGKVRRHNEDAAGIFTKEDAVLAVVADGMGGHLAGDVASRMAVAAMEEQWNRTETVPSLPSACEDWLKDRIHEANVKVHDHAKANEECRGMGTTIVCALFTGKFVTVAHIGDSRCYLLQEGEFTQLTEDHSLVNELVKTGKFRKRTPSTIRGKMY